MKTRNRFILAGLISTLLLPQVASAQVPNLVSYQGRVAVGTANFEGTGQFKFALVNAAGTTVYWGNAADTTPADGVPDAAVSLPVSKGLYSALLGDTSIANMATIPASVWANPDVRLRVWFNDGVNGNQLLTPDQRIAPAGYLADGSVSAAKLATGAVDSPQLAGSAITSAKLASGAVTSAKLANNLTLGGTTTGTFSGSGAALTNLAAANLTGALPPLDASALTNLNGANLTANSVGNSQLADGAVTAAKLGADVGLWNVSGADVFRSVGKVGIGTNSVLGRELQVDGTAPAILIGSESFGRTSLLMGVTANSGGYSIIQSVSSAGGLIGALSLQPNGGEVGIGTDTPAAKLDVNGDIKSSGTFIGDGSGLTGVVATSTARTPQQIALLKWGVNSVNNTYTAGNNPNAVCFDGASIWVTNAGSDNVTKLNAITGAVIGTYAVGNNPNAVCFDGANIWVVNYFTQNVTKLNAGTGAVIGTYAVGGNPYAICFDGANIWVTSDASNNVTKLNASTGALIGTYAVGSNPRGICIDGASIWVSNLGSDNVTKLNASTGAVIGTYTVGNNPRAVCFDGASIWVANINSNNVTKLNASTGALIGTYAVGTNPRGICFDGASIWVANLGTNDVTKLNASTGAVLGTHAVGTGPVGICFDGASIWVPNNGSDNVTKL